MQKPQYHIAQINIAKMLAPVDDPLLADFVSELDAVNALADQADGFVWRLQSEEGNATDIRAFDNPMLLINMSVWESIDALFEYTYNNQHLEIFRARRKWFAKPEGTHLALWWVASGHTPTVEEGKQHLQILEKNGPTPEVFTFKNRFPLPNEG